MVTDFTSHTGSAGVMLWDAGNSDSATESGRTYAQEVRNVLDKGQAC